METVEVILKLGIVIGGGIISSRFLIAGLCILFCDKELYEQNRQASLLCKKYRNGTLSPSETYDFQEFRALGFVKSGMTANTRTKQIEISAKLSDEALDRVFESGRRKVLKVLTFDIYS